MSNFEKFKLGIYEKALPGNLSWPERLAVAKALGFDYVEMSVDEQDFRLARLDWTKEQRLEVVKACLDTGITIPSMCLSGHRRFPFGSQDPKIQEQAYSIMEKAFQLAIDLGIRNIQLAGYDVYYEEQTEQTIADFVKGMQWTAAQAAKHQVMVSVEIMDTKFMSSISRWLELNKQVDNPWFAVYPDVGNLSAWGNDVPAELEKGIHKITAIHLKDTYAVTETCKGQFRDVPFGDGCVDFVQVFRTLEKLNYRGSFLIEMWTEKSSQPLTEIANAKAWLLDKMREGGYLC